MYYHFKPDQDIGNAFCPKEDRVLPLGTTSNSMSLWLKKPSAVHGYLMQMKWWPPMRMKRRNSFIHFAEVKWAAVRVRYSERPWCDWEQQFQWLPENVEILKKDFHFKLCVCVCVCAHLCWVCQIIQTPGCHGWVRELAHNEGDVPQLLPVSDASLNQEWREKLTLLEKKSMLLSRQMWVCCCVFVCAVCLVT